MKAAWMLGFGLLLTALPALAAQPQDVVNYTTAVAAQVGRVAAASDDLIHVSETVTPFTQTYYNRIDMDCNAIIETSKAAHQLRPPKAYAKSYTDYVAALDNFQAGAMLMPVGVKRDGSKKLAAALHLMKLGETELMSADKETDGVSQKNGWLTAGQ